MKVVEFASVDETLCQVDGAIVDLRNWVWETGSYAETLQIYGDWISVLGVDFVRYGRNKFTYEVKTNLYFWNIRKCKIYGTKSPLIRVCLPP